MQPAPALDADPRAGVVGEPERRQRPEGDDARSRPNGLVAAHERQRDIREAGVKEAVAEQRQPMDEQGGERRERERLVDGPQVGSPASQQAAAHQQPHRDRQAGEHERGDARGATGEPEQVGPGRGCQQLRLGADHASIKTNLAESRLGAGWALDEPSREA